MKRKIIRIDEDTCTGCGDCIPNCPEGALQMIDGKARLVSDLFCDGLGACIGHCPEGAITFEEREAEPYDERRVMENIIPKGENTIQAHLKHLYDHGEEGFLNEAVALLEEEGIDVPEYKPAPAAPGVCPGAAAMAIERPGHSQREDEGERTPQRSRLKNWPVQLHLINPGASYFRNADLLVSADCVPYAYAGFHSDYLEGKVMVTFCPKLDDGLDRYVEKMAMVFREQEIRSVTILYMQVPCCGGTRMIVEKAMEQAGVAVEVRSAVIGIDGNILQRN